MPSKLSLDIAANPFPWTAALLASHQGIELDFNAGKVAFDGQEGVEAVEAALSKSFSAENEAALPPLPTKLDGSTPFPELMPILNALDDHLALRTYFSTLPQIGSPDLSVFGTLRSSPKALGLLKQNKHVHLHRWYAHVEALKPTQLVIAGVYNAKSSSAKGEKAEKDKAGGVDATLPNAVDGKVVVRFAPEPSGYLHIGHLKALLLNRFLADKYHGQFLLRFDDTNPDKEEEEFEGSFESDLTMLGVGWDRVVHTSDWFDRIEGFARDLVKGGKAYMDDTDQMTMREQRMAFQPSKNRDNSVEDNLARFEGMLMGSEEGKKWFMRAKIDYKSTNGAMRDPAVYRAVDKPHHVTGDKFKAYPMYDLACPIVDHLDGVTHALRANEYADRKPQYEWFLQACGLPHIEIFDFSRLDFVYTLLSKRKLKSIVQLGKVTSWEDPRFPTVRGMRARGLTFEALKGFIASQGASSATLLMEWDQIWAFNKKVIDPIAPRYWAIEEKDLVKVHVSGASKEAEVRTLPAHKKNPVVGDKKTVFSSELLIEQVDAESFGENEEITAMDWGNAFVRSKSKSDAGVITEIELDLHLEGDFKKTSKKVHWLSAPDAQHKLVPVVLIDYDYLITKKKIEAEDDFMACLNDKTEYRTPALADANVVDLNRFDIIQFERKGFYIFQGTKDDEGRMEFGFIPDGKIGSVALKAKPYEVPAAAASAGAPVDKAWGKDAKPSTATKSAAAPTTSSAEKPSKVYLSDVGRGFEMPSTCGMYEADRIYGKEEVIALAPTVNMYKVKPVYD